MTSLQSSAALYENNETYQENNQSPVNLQQQQQQQQQEARGTQSHTHHQLPPLQSNNQGPLLNHQALPVPNQGQPMYYQPAIDNSPTSSTASTYFEGVDYDGQITRPPAPLQQTQAQVRHQFTQEPQQQGQVSQLSDHTQMPYHMHDNTSVTASETSSTSAIPHQTYELYENGTLDGAEVTSTLPNLVDHAYQTT
ncbi:hypothetical protein PP707_08615, partial [Acetobacter pasteurianus]|nr:hypothetical protein [Acetobacter pasteurianus]